MGKFISMVGTLSTAHKWYIFKYPLRLIKRGQPALSGAVARKLSELLGDTGLPATAELVIYERAWCLVETGDDSAVPAMVEILKAKG